MGQLENLSFWNYAGSARHHSQITDESGQVVAVFFGPRHMANACMACAAPEMAQQLRTLIAFHDRLHDGVQPRRLLDLATEARIRDLLAKSECEDETRR